jgi:CubicO group peptidase (beta-lactamase class C family)
MTKPVASLAAMMLLEEGRFLLDDPISKWLPEFKDMHVAVPNQPNERGAPGYRLVPAERPITIRHLLSHSAGLASGTSGVTMADYQALRDLRAAEKPIDAYVTALAKLPLTFQPGEAWEYGPATDVLGRLVEVISGQTLDAFFRERIFKPLGMTDTHFYLPQDKLARRATLYAPSPQGLKAQDRPVAAAENGKLFSAGGGLSGTAADYLRLCQMFLNGGRLDDVRLLSRKSVEAMTTNQIGDARLWQNTYPNYGFGLGFRVRLEVGRTPTLGSAGEYGWGGAHGTYFFIDPVEELIGILMIQLNPYAHLNLRPEFQNMVNQAIVD